MKNLRQARSFLMGITALMIMMFVMMLMTATVSTKIAKTKTVSQSIEKGD
jgi:cell division protein FtsN